MLVITRQLTAIAILLPCVAYAVLLLRGRWRQYALALLGAVPPVLFLLLYNWALMGNPFSSTYNAQNPNDLPGFGPHPGPWGGIFTVADGLWNTSLNLSMLLPQLYGWPFGLALAFAFLPFVLGAARRWDLLLLACLLSLIAAYSAYFASGLMYGPRYYYEGLPPLFLLTARGMVELGRLPNRLWPRFGVRQDRELAAFFPLVLAGALLLFNLRFYLPSQLSLYHNYNYSSDTELRAVERARIHHAVVFVVSPPGIWYTYGNVLFENDPLLKGDVIYVRDLGARDQELLKYFPNRTRYRLDGITLTRLG
jgi:hypothetical protein